MIEIGEKYLPIGTVCMLKGGTKRVMISGFCSVDNQNKDVMFDYSGCIYPEGFLSSDQTALFNHDQIALVYHLGLIDEEEKTFKEKLKNIIGQIDNIVPQVEPVVSENSNIQVPTPEITQQEPMIPQEPLTVDSLPEIEVAEPTLEPTFIQENIVDNNTELTPIE